MSGLSVRVTVPVIGDCFFCRQHIASGEATVRLLNDALAHWRCRLRHDDEPDDEPDW